MRNKTHLLEMVNGIHVQHQPVKFLTLTLGGAKGLCQQGFSLYLSTVTGMLAAHHTVQV